MQFSMKMNTVKTVKTTNALFHILKPIDKTNKTIKFTL